MTPTQPHFNLHSFGPASSIEELLSLHDEFFVRRAYATVLGREPDPTGLAHFVGRIRSGESREAILAALRLSPEGREQDHVLEGLDEAIRIFRWRRWPVIGPILRMCGVGRERADVQIAAINATLRRLSELGPSRSTLDTAAAQQARADELATRLTEEQLRADELQVRLIALQVRAGDLQLRLNAKQQPARELAGRGAEQQPIARAPLQRKSVSQLIWRIEEGVEAFDGLSGVRVETTRAFAELGLRVLPASQRIAADVTAIFASPPLLRVASEGQALLIGLDWDESGYSAEWVEQLNRNVSAIACASSHAAKILVDHGVTVPVAAVGLGVDDWDRVYPSPDYRAPGKGFRFLHVSTCGISQGVDLLLESFGRVFSRHDEVSLVIYPLGDTQSELTSMLQRLRSSSPDFPDVVLLEERLSEADLKSLYEQCDVFAAPSRAEGFGLPLARALLSGLPIVATAWGGHCDYCDETNAYLVDYRFGRARSAKNLIVSIWAEPLPDSLDAALRSAWRSTPAERAAMAAAGRRRLREEFTWTEVALRLVGFADRNRSHVPRRDKHAKIGWLTTWNVKCGIATHAEHLLATVPTDDFVVFAARQVPQVRADNLNCIRSWDVSKEKNGLDEVLHQLLTMAIQTIVIQHNYGLYRHAELNSFIETVVDKGIVVFIEVHSTVDTDAADENWSLRGILSSLRKCHRILVHGPADMDRLKALGLIENVMLLPHGVVVNCELSRSRKEQQSTPLLASFGFCFPNKGLLELVEAVSVLKQQGRLVRLRMMNAVYPNVDSLAVAQQIREAVTRHGLEDRVELNTDFLDEDVCLARLSEADLLVNPYQQSGESASGAVRYGMTCGSPVAVTPLPIFDDLGDAVFRMPGTSALEIAEGIAAALDHVNEKSNVARQVEDSARRWTVAHDYSRQVDLLRDIARSLAPPVKRVRGVFINTAPASCSIHESGRMVYNCVKESAHHILDYFSLDMLDLSVLKSQGRLKPLATARNDGSHVLEPYDFWVFNWHFITMAGELDPESIRRLPGTKFSVVLELEPSDPLKLVPPGVFDGFIALDPSAPRTPAIFPFPRPLEGEPRRIAYTAREVPVIGSFGFGTPGKGFELLVEAVNREFDEAVVRINVPTGTYTSSTDDYHGQDYPKYIADLCRRIAKPGIEVRFTHDYMSPEALVDWCAQNDLNCFMYTRRQSGLSATTDQAVMSGRPLLTSSNDTFRHIHQYIPPYPVTGLREAIETTMPSVHKLQHDWSRSAFNSTFQQMLAAFGLISAAEPDSAATAVEKQRPTILVASRPGTDGDDIFSYAKRVADCLGRSSKYEVARAHWHDASDLEAQVEKLQPSAVLVLDSQGVPHRDLAAAVQTVAGPRILLTDEPRQAPASNGLALLRRQPIVPYYTYASALRAGMPGIWMMGFSAPDSALEDIVLKIARELGEVEIFLEVHATGRPAFETRVANLRARHFKDHAITLAIHSVTMTCESIVGNVAASNLTIFHNDSKRTQELEDASSIAMVTERPVAFSRAGPFPHFLGGATYVEDHPVRDLMMMGMKAQIRLAHDFGEGPFYAQFERLMSRSYVGTEPSTLFLAEGDVPFVVDG